MKNTIIALLTSTISSLCYAQINKGTLLAGASSNIGYNNYSSKTGSDLTIFNVNFKAGYFIIENLVAGINLAHFGSSSSSAGSSSSYSITSTGIFTRYYLPKNIFIGAGISSTAASSTSSGSSTGSLSSSSRSTSIPFELGIAAFITKNFAIEPSINYTRGEDNGGLIYNGTTSVSGVTSSIGLNLGFTFYLNRE